MEKQAIQFLEARPHLVWYVGDIENLSENSLVEHVLNYGTWQDVQELISILGMQHVAEIFQKQASATRSNYRPDMRHYFTLYFNRHAA